MRIPLILASYCSLVPVAAYLTMHWDSSREKAAVQLLNVSCDPTRELWRSLNHLFVDEYVKRTGIRVHVRQSHGGSASQARSVIDGLQADVVTLALWIDTDALCRQKLIGIGWEERLPRNSMPYYSTIVFVVRRGNPKNIRDWPDLIRPGVEVITPNPKTSGNGKLSFLAAWGSVKERGGTDEQALAFVSDLYRHVPILDTGARGAATTFALNGRGDVQLAWENEARLEIQESGNELELVYPPNSIRAESPVALVDAVVDARGTRDVAQAYLEFLFSPEAQEVIASHYYRPASVEVLQRHRDTFPEVKLFSIMDVALDWRAAQARFFDANGVFDRIYDRMNSGQ